LVGVKKRLMSARAEARPPEGGPSLFSVPRYTVIRNGSARPLRDWLPKTIEPDTDAAPAYAVRTGEFGASGKVDRRRDCEEPSRADLAAGP
jgi:hypothetical protein